MRTFLLLILLATLAACGSKQETGKAEEKAPEAPANSDSIMQINQVTGLARIEPPEKVISLNARAEGYVKAVYYKENQSVTQGQLLIALDDDIEQAQLRQAQSKLKAQQAAAEGAEATLASIKVKLAEAQNTLERNQRLSGGNALTRQELDDSRFKVSDLEKQVSAQSALVNKEKGRLDELQADIGYYETLVARKQIKAPLSGVFLSSDVKAGTFINANTVIGEFAVEGPYQAVAEIDELFAGRIAIGQSAHIRPQGETKVLTKGKVAFVGPYLKKKSLFSDGAGNLEDRRVREIRVQLDSQEGLLIGSRVECVVEVNK